MRRSVAIAWHASFFVLAAALYFFFVLPRWLELTGAWPLGLGQSLRIVDGVLVGLTALPVVFTLLHTRKPEFGTPQLALTLRLSSIVLHVLAGVLILGAAIAELWISLDSAGQWLFGIYGAAAALAVLGALGFYLAYLAELPPPPPKPLKIKDPSGSRRRRKSAADDLDEDDTEDQADIVETVATETDDVETDDVETDAAETDAPEDVPASEEVIAEAAESEAEPTAEHDSDGDAESDGAAEGSLRNRRPEAKPAPRRIRRRRGGVAVDE